MKFPESAFAHKYLDGLGYGVEIGLLIDAHTRFGLQRLRLAQLPERRLHGRHDDGLQG